MIPRGNRSLGLALPMALLALLFVLAVLQYRWTGALSRAEAERLKTHLESSLSRFSIDFDEELVRVLRTFSMSSPDELGETMAEFRHQAPYPEVVEGVYRIGFGDGRVTLSTLDEDGALAPAAWPAGLERFQDRLEDLRHSHRDRHRGQRPPIAILSLDPLAIVVTGRFRARSSTLVVFRDDVIRQRILPDLASRHFGSGEALDYDVVVLDEQDRVVFSSRPDASKVVEAPDASLSLLSLHGAFGRPRPGRNFFEGRWTAFVRHRAGSLDAVVGRTRAWNLALGSGVLLILGLSIVLVTVSARRATELSERKMEFVAGVSHELRTPLAVIQSAAQNLSHGSVSGAEQVKRYGGLIEAEGRRLFDLVENVLELAGVQSHARRSGRERVSAAKIAEAAVEDCAPAARDREVAIQTAFSARDPAVLGDGDSLRRGIANLVANAVKHGDGDNSVVVAVESRNGEVVISVSDLGPGIHASDLPHVFDAFYRGKHARERQVPGSGLGLSLVQLIARDHGGRIEVESNPGKGSRFSLILPEAPEAV